MARVAWLLTAAYPLLVYWSSDRLPSGMLLLLLLPLVVLQRSAISGGWLLPMVVGVLAFAAVGLRSQLPQLIYPVAVNGILLCVFLDSLLRPPTVVERIARLRDPALPAAARPYLVSVTRAWCAFFVVNGGLALATVLWGSRELWALYNGLIAYLLIGAMFVIERIVRQRRQAAFHD